MGRIFLRSALLVAGIIDLALAVGFILQIPVVTNLWPLPDGRLAFSFMAAILAGSAFPLLWIGWSGELAALRGYALGFLVMYGGMAANGFRTTQDHTVPLVISKFG